jgi:2-C-methyl-D-erythritol 4-phosphate cytidylyltransferase
VFGVSGERRNMAINTRPTVVVIVPAGGRGDRMGGDVPKQYLPLAGKPVLWHTLAAFEASDWVDRLVLVLRPDDMEHCRRHVLEPGGFSKVAQVVEGGDERFSSVQAGLELTKAADEVVLVHDAVRPFFCDGLLQRVVEAAASYGAAVPGLPLKETVKRVGQGVIEATLERHTLYGAQTPQGFHRDILLKAYDLLDQRRNITDDAMLVEAAGYKVHLVEGEEDNIKITTPLDLEWATWRLGSRKKKEIE